MGYLLNCLKDVGVLASMILWRMEMVHDCLRAVAFLTFSMELSIVPIP